MEESKHSKITADDLIDLGFEPTGCDLHPLVLKLGDIESIPEEDRGHVDVLSVCVTNELNRTSLVIMTGFGDRVELFCRNKSELKIVIRCIAGSYPNW